MNYKVRFLSVLWIFVICDFVLFQNFTQSGSATELHNDMCKQSLDLNETRISQVDAVKGKLLAAWPPGTSANPNAALKSMNAILKDGDRQIYEACLTDGAVRDSHTYALVELKKFADPDSNNAWKRYVNTLEGALDSLNKGPL
jgi:hypothetical protein